MPSNLLAHGLQTKLVSLGGLLIQCIYPHPLLASSCESIFMHSFYVDKVDGDIVIEDGNELLEPK